MHAPSRAVFPLLSPPPVVSILQFLAIKKNNNNSNKTIHYFFFPAQCYNQWKRIYNETTEIILTRNRITLHRSYFLNLSSLKQDFKS